MGGWSGVAYSIHSDRVLREESITLKELVPVVLACAVWGRQWSDCMVVVHCGNEEGWQPLPRAIAEWHPSCTC